MIKHDGKELVALNRALEAGERLSDRQLVLLASIQRDANAGRCFVRISRALPLRPGEELMEFGFRVMDAVHADRTVLADGSLCPMVEGIFDSYVVVRDLNTGRLFRAEFTRDEDGAFAFGAPVEVEVQFVPLPAPVEGEAQRAAPATRVVELIRSESKWGTILPKALRASVE